MRTELHCSLADSGRCGSGGRLWYTPSGMLKMMAPRLLVPGFSLGFRRCSSHRRAPPRKLDAIPNYRTDAASSPQCFGQVATIVKKEVGFALLEVRRCASDISDWGRDRRR